jgi:hypothetical protein
MKKKIVLFIAICFCLKSLALVNGIELPIDSSTPVVQSAVFQVVSIIGMPFSVMADILKGSALFPEYRNEAKKQDHKKKSNPQDSKCLFTLIPKITSKLMLKIGSIGNSAVVIANKAMFSISACFKVIASDWEQIICAIILSFLILLPRRSLPWASILSRIYILPNYVLGVIGFFLWLNRIKPLITQISTEITQIESIFNKSFGGINEI